MISYSVIMIFKSIYHVPYIKDDKYYLTVDKSATMEEWHWHNVFYMKMDFDAMEISDENLNNLDEIFLIFIDFICCNSSFIGERSNKQRL